MINVKLRMQTLALAVMGLATGATRTGSVIKTYTSALKQRQWHDPGRLGDAEQRRASRQARNLRQAAAGGYGKNWMTW